MATKTFEELKQLAIQIRDEKTNKQNTATRVGTAMLEHINKLEQDYYDKTTINNRTSEYNVSINHPTSGISSSNKYDLSSAIAQVPAELRTAGLKVSFLNSSGKPESWEFQSGSWTTGNFLPDGSWKINSLIKAGYIFSGIATPSTTPISTTEKIFYLASQDGTYTNFSNITLDNEIAALVYSGSSWSKQSLYSYKNIGFLKSFSSFPINTVADNNGAEKNLSNCASSPFIQVTAGEKFYVYLNCANYNTVCFYNPKSGIDSPSNVNPNDYDFVSSVNIKNGTVTIPDGVSYVRFQSAYNSMGIYGLQERQAFYMSAKNPIPSLINTIIGVPSFSSFPINSISNGVSNKNFGNAFSSPFIDVSKGDQFYVYLDAGTYPTVCYYNLKEGVTLNSPEDELNIDNYEFVSKGEVVNNIVTIPDNVGFVRFQSFNGFSNGSRDNMSARQAIYVSLKNPLMKKNLEYTTNIPIGDTSEVKKILFFGDSIVYGQISGSVPDYNGTSRSWVNRLCELMGVEGSNHGVKGMLLTTEDFYDNIVNTNVDSVDLIIIAIGANDCGVGTLPIGTINDSVDTQSVHGFFKKSIDKIQEKWPGVRIVCIGVYETNRNNKIYNTSQFNNAIYEECVSYRCGYITKACLGFPYPSDPYSVYSKYLSDGLHPTGFASYVYANAVYSYLKYGK